MKRADLGAVLRYDGELHEVIGVDEGRSLILAPVSKAAFDGTELVEGEE